MTSDMPALIPLLWPTLVSLAKDSEPTSWIQVAKTGSFFSTRYGTFSITPDDLRQMLHNFTTVTPIPPTELPVDYDHLSMEPKQVGDGKAAGWFVTGQMELRAEDQELWAQIRWTPEGADAIKNSEYRFISPSFIRDYVWKNGKNIGMTLVAAAITNHPFLEGMAAVTLMSDSLGSVATPANLGMGYDQKRERVYSALKAMLAMTGLYDECYVKDMDDTHIVYGMYSAGGSVDRVYRREYALRPDGGVTFSGDAEEVYVQWAPVASLRGDRNMADVFTLRDAKGATTEVKADDLQTFLADQIAAATALAKAAAVPEGSVVIQASTVKEFEATKAEVVSLTSTVATLTADADKLKTDAAAARQDAHNITLNARLTVLSNAGRVTKPMRDWAAKTFASPDAMAAFEEWAASVPAAPIVALHTEYGSGDSGQDAPANPAKEVHQLASTRARERNIPYRQAANEIMNENTDLATAYRGEVYKGKRETVRH